MRWQIPYRCQGFITAAYFRFATVLQVNFLTAEVSAPASKLEKLPKAELSVQVWRSLPTPYGFRNVLIIVRCTTVSSGTGYFAEQATLLIFSNNGGDNSNNKITSPWLYCQVWAQLCHRCWGWTGGTHTNWTNSVLTTSRVPDAWSG